MTTKLVAIQGTSYALYSADDIHGNAPDSGTALFENATLYEWEHDFELVQNIETWLRSKFSDFSCIGRLSILEYLRDKVMQGEVRVVRAEPMSADNGFVQPPRLAAPRSWETKPFDPPYTYYSLLPVAPFDFDGWHSQLESWTNDFGDAVATALPTLRGSNLTRTRLNVAAAIVGVFNQGSRLTDAVDLGDVTAIGEASTPLSGAAPFEYFSSAPSDGVLSMAMRSGRDAQCFADYEQDMEMCNVAKAMYGGDPRTYTLCSSRASENYRTCLGY
ncbi:hypothetical protein SBC1_01680 [Caballeronia sp. SBC1]|uniref:hypothetical protein n=1 Tax=Caballeronia sp. SBC1 TaxID=2705548 RepID=UPI00140D446F|nr:hypothetical protein [Caballeronia sp. SBC1]QIN60193.1 hypothetical protein SBC1_01680 [Caballeronia sp. SBC1]